MSQESSSGCIDRCRDTGHDERMTTTTAAPHLSKIEDHEGFGVCGECAREGLRWIAVLSNGSQVGLECAKKVMGWKPAPKSYAWIADYTPVAERTECGSTYVMWQHKTVNATRETRDGSLTAIGNIRTDWTRRGWL